MSAFTHQDLATNRYVDRQFGVEAVKLLPGEYYVASDDSLLVTVLGSCVSACIRDKVLGIGGMNHFMLAGGTSDAANSSARYGTFAMEILINHLLKLGARRHQLEAKVFGGGRIVSSLSNSQVGERNARFVLDFLATEGIPIVAKDLLDVCPRRVYFFPKSGRVLVNRLKEVKSEQVQQRESEYAARLNQAPSSGDIELFV